MVIIISFPMGVFGEAFSAERSCAMIGHRVKMGQWIDHQEHSLPTVTGEARACNRCTARTQFEMLHRLLSLKCHCSTFYEYIAIITLLSTSVIPRIESQNTYCTQDSDYVQNSAADPVCPQEQRSVTHKGLLGPPPPNSDNRAARI